MGGIGGYVLSSTPSLIKTAFRVQHSAPRADCRQPNGRRPTVAFLIENSPAQNTDLSSANERSRSIALGDFSRPRVRWASAFTVTRRRTAKSFRTSNTNLKKSLFDEDEPSNEPVSRKFTGQDYFSSGPARAGGEGGTSGPMSPRDQMRQREYNLVSLATSPSAFLVQAASIVFLLVLVIYVGATGQLGLNNDYEDDYFNYDPETVILPENVIPESKESVWL
eukprot:scaffold34621_cov166-Amphora_coffeaeformis.AAC.15